MENVNNGRLKLLVGVISWPGNTIALLREGQELAARGRDVAIGILQYDNPEIAALKETLTDTFPLPPAREKDAPPALNLPWLLSRKPDVVLIDGVGEKNPPGSQYQTRWQEAEVLLNAGIDVVATVDALHLEGYRALFPLPLPPEEATVPLSFLRRAAEVELVDVTPEELRRHGLDLPPGFEPHLSLGRYLAVANFAAFRRTVLQRIADEVDERLLRPGFEPRVTAARERILLAISGPGNLERLLSKSLVLTTHLQASLLVVHLKVPQKQGWQELPRKYIAERIAPVGGRYVEEEIADEAEVPERLSQLVVEHHITRMVVGHSARTRLAELLHGAVLAELLHRNRHIDVLVVANLPYETREEPSSPGDEVPAVPEYPREARLPGKLKVYLGPIAGVGKTYRMLRDANELKRKGTDVVIGLVETHGRPETAAQIGNLEVLPRKAVFYRGRVFTELNLEAILQRRPQVVLVDELAHTNIPGVKNEKRYQDVLELLAAGIDVWTTLNVQHVESLNDLVEQITGVKVRETLPDWVLSLATEIILVDLSSELLLQRMEGGKIYPPEKAAQALHHFFRPENITALRELALRQLAHHLSETRSPTLAQDQQGDRPERILVAVNLRPYAERLIRRGLRLSIAQKAALFVVHCDTTGKKFDPVAVNTRRYIQHLCTSLGIPYIEQPVFSDRDVAAALAHLCLTKRVTQLVLGHSRRTRWQQFFKGTIINRLLQNLRTVDLHLIPVDGVR